MNNVYDECVVKVIWIEQHLFFRQKAEYTVMFFEETGYPRMPDVSKRRHTF